MKSSTPEPTQQQKPLGEKVVPTPPPPGENWRPWGTSNVFEVNDKGQVRTKHHPLPK